MTWVLDAGALLALERGDRVLHAALDAERRAGRMPRTHGGIVGQVWRGGAGRLARAMASVEVMPLDEELGRRAGVLLGRAGSRDVVDAALVLLASDGDVVLTSDPVDVAELAQVAELDVEIVPV